MLKPDDLKTWLHKQGLTQLDKLLLVLAAFDGSPAQVKDIKERAKAGGLKITGSWNPSSTMSKSAGLAINSGAGWELTVAGREHLRKLGVSNLPASAVNVATDLRNKLSNIKNSDTRDFVEEAIACFEHGFYRSAVVMGWAAAISVLHHHVHAHHLADFNKEAARVDQKWKAAKTTDDLGLMAEDKFLDRLMGISVIGKNVKDELQKCLKLRNGCGHPNSMKIGPNAVASHLKILLFNVFTKF